MKILVCNNRYFISGGPERYMFSLINMLQMKGNKVIPFAINYNKNNKSEYSHYFANPPLDEKHIYYNDSKLSLLQKLRLSFKTIYNFEAAKKLRKVIKNENIDIVYTLQVVNFLYSCTINESYKMGIPVVSRFSDFQLLCPAYTFFRDGIICEDCKKGYLHAIKNKCLQNSYGVSFARVIAMYMYKLLKIQKKIDMLVAPSKFLRQKLIEAGFDKSKVVYIPSYIDINQYEPKYNDQSYVLYVGNIVDYKGVDVLIKAFKNIYESCKLKIVGRLNNGEYGRLKQYVSEEGFRNVEFLGYKKGNEVKHLYQNAMFVVVPSVWYENLPNVILEAMAYGKPVIGTRLGSIPEIVDHNINGLCFEPANSEDLTMRMLYLIDNKNIRHEMGKNARQKVECEYNSSLHYDRIMSTYQKVIN